MVTPKKILIQDLELADKEIKRLREENKKMKKICDVYVPRALKLEEENKKLKDIIGKIVYLYKEEPTELGEYVKSGFKGGMSN